jgi:pyruvate ferredoxin oxidoreductase delta subunit
MTDEDKTPMIGVSPPIEGEAGQTGTWRSKRPVIDPKRCLTCGDKPRDCQLCWMYCPEAVIAQGRPPVIDYRYCKGCGICGRECPRKAIDMVSEQQE